MVQPKKSTVMKNVINRAFAAKKKLMILAISAFLVTNISAQEMKKVCPFDGKQMTKEERVESDIKHLTKELMLSDQQAEKFAVIYREYAGKMDELFEKNMEQFKFEPGKELTDKELDKLAKQRFNGMKDLADLQSKYYNKFRKELSARQVEKVFRFNEPFGGKPCCGKHDGKCDKHKKHHPKGPHPEAPLSIPEGE